MLHLRPGFLAAAVMLSVPGIATAGPHIVEHVLSVNVDAARSRIEAVDRIDAGRRGVEFTLNSGLEPSLDSAALAAGARLEQAGPGRSDSRAAEPLQRRYRAATAPGSRVLTLRYAGTPLFAQPRRRAERARPGGDLHPGGYFDADGLLLSASDAWYPLVEDALVRFELALTLPAGWSAPAQGRAERTGGPAVRFVQDYPQQQIHLVAGPYTVTTRRAGPAGTAVSTFLLSADAPLAARYLDAAGEYLPLYARLLGDYPYTSFALVENRRQTGFGMPGFTLLGSRVLRLPFIARTSFPHEIVHSWFGNAVYVKPGSANWSEGLTAYLADHLSAELRGEGARHRRSSLRRYTTFAQTGRREMAIAEFRARHGAASAAVGYDKSLMVFHALRRAIGDTDFVSGLRRFYARHRFTEATYADLERAFEAASGRVLSPFFEQWIERAGAPELALRDVEVTRGDAGYRVRGVLAQAQPGRAFDMSVPVALQAHGATQAQVKEVYMSGSDAEFEFTSERPPARLEVDPAFDVPRRLGSGELPPSLGELFASTAPDVSMPPGSNVADARRNGAIAAALRAGSPASAVAGTTNAEWILGFDNPGAARFLEAASAFGLRKTGAALEVGGRQYSVFEHCFAFAARDASGHPIGWAVCEAGSAAQAAAVMARVRHYGGASYVISPTDRERRTVHAEWPLWTTPLAVAFVTDAAPAALPARAPMTSAGD